MSKRLTGCFASGAIRPRMSKVISTGRQGHRQESGKQHGKGFRIGQRFEQPPLLGFQSKDGQKRDGDHQQRKEQRVCRLPPPPGRSPPCGYPGGRLHPTLQRFVGVLHHDDRGIDHGADGDSDAAQGHDVGVDPQRMHGDERDEDRHWQSDNDHQGAGPMKQEDQTTTLTMMRSSSISSSFKVAIDLQDQIGAIIDRRRSLRRPARMGSISSIFASPVRSNSARSRRSG